MVLAHLFLAFMLYSFLGWLWETLLFVFRDRRFVNRGFLYGPFCPIYGSGALICCLILYGRVENFALLFIIGAVLCSLLEYVTHWALELLFHARWWDYSSNSFNLRGRICLSSTLAFGLCIALLVDYIHPFVMASLNSLPPATAYVLAALLYTILVSDITLTIAGLVGLRERLEALQSTIAEHMQKGIDLTEEMRQALIEKLESSQIYRERLAKLTLPAFTSRLVRNFPELSSERYREALEKVREKLKKRP